MLQRSILQSTAQWASERSRPDTVNSSICDAGSTACGGRKCETGFTDHSSGNLYFLEEGSRRLRDLRLALDAAHHAATAILATVVRCCHAAAKAAAKIAAIPIDAAEGFFVSVYARVGFIVKCINHSLLMAPFVAMALSYFLGPCPEHQALTSTSDLKVDPSSVLDDRLSSIGARTDSDDLGGDLCAIPAQPPTPDRLRPTPAPKGYAEGQTSYTLPSIRVPRGYVCPEIGHLFPSCHRKLSQQVFCDTREHELLTPPTAPHLTILEVNHVPPSFQGNDPYSGLHEDSDGA
eukprot:jgi/Ulvmu1/1728/UM117_0005.1